MSDRLTYNTRQRRQVLECISSGGHMTADQIADCLRERGNRVGKSTVYRHLAALTEEGLVRRYQPEGGAGACYQFVADRASCGGHCHLKCSVCGELFHLDGSALEGISVSLRESCGFALDYTRTILYGKCKKCGEKAGEIT